MRCSRVYGCTELMLRKLLQIFMRIFQVKPNDDSTWYDRGIALDKLGRYEEAIASFEKSLQIKPDNNLA